MVELIPFSVAQPRTFNTLLCDGVSARRLPSFADLLDLHFRLQHEQPHCRVLASLDDLAQACYTSGHGTDAYGLDDVAGHDLSELSPDLFEGGEHPGHLSTPAEFPIRLANLLKRANAVELADIAGVLDWEPDGEGNDPYTVNADPEAALRIGDEREVLFQFVPVVTAAETIAAFPNGYFEPDLSPMQNYLLARHLETSHGLSLFGLGSRFLAFRRPHPFDETEAGKLAADITGLYANCPADATEDLAHLLVARDWLLLRYTES